MACASRRRWRQCPPGTRPRPGLVRSGQQRPRVEEATLVGVVLDADEVVAGRVADLRPAQDFGVVGLVRAEEVAESGIIDLGHVCLKFQ